MATAERNADFDASVRADLSRSLRWIRTGAIVVAVVAIVEFL